MKLLKLLLTLACIQYCSLVSAETNTNTMIFDHTFKSLKIHIEGNEFSPAIIDLYGKDRITVAFDQLVPDVNYLRYALVHCDADWKPSQILDSEYIEGFNEDEIDNYSLSSATFTQFVHYELNVPNEDMRLTLSGNYLLKVYPEGEPENVCLQARFSVVDKKVKVYPEITSRTDVDYNSQHQQISVAIDNRDYRIENPYADLKVVVVQNSRYDIAKMVSHPQRVAGDKIYFEHNPELIFKAGNEFRRFEMVNTRYNGIGIEKYIYNNPFYHVVLKTDEPRSYESYIYDRTQYGKYVIRQSDAYDSNTEADYMYVHFALAMPEIQEGSVYVDGEFTQHNFEPGNLMKYNHNTQCYELDMRLKQGVYNYQYLWKPKNQNKYITETIEGDFYQTINEYQVFVYTRQRTDRYDRLIGYNIIYSGK